MAVGGKSIKILQKYVLLCDTLDRFFQLILVANFT